MQIQAFPLVVREPLAAPAAGGKSPTELLVSRLGLGEIVEAVVIDTAPRGAVLDAKGIPITLAGVADLPVGSELALKVTSLTPQLHLQVVTIAPPGPDSTEPLVNNSALAANAETSAASPGGAAQSAQALVVTLNAPLRPGVTIRISRSPLAGSRAEAGREIEAQPVQAGESPRATPRNLDGLTSEELQGGALRLLFGQTADLAPSGESLAALQQALAQVATEAPHLAGLRSVSQLRDAIESLVLRPAELNAEAVARSVEKAGYQYEAALANHVDDPEAAVQTAATDLKAVLHQVQADLRANLPAPPAKQAMSVSGDRPPSASIASRPAAAELVRLVDSHLANIETHQALNLLAKANGGPLQLQIPVLFGKTPTTMTWEIESDDDSTDGQDADSSRPNATRLVLRMELEHFGPTVVEARAAANSLHVQFFVSQPEAVSAVEAGLPSLQDSLHKAGFSDVHVAAGSLAGTAPMDDVSAPGLGTNSLTHHLLDVRA